MTDLYSESFSVIQLEFNLPPINSWIVMQMMRVYVIGHLSGILCGFALHWKWLRLSICVPYVWGTMVIIILLWKVDKVTFETSDEVHLLDTLALEEDNTDSTYQSMKEVMTQFFVQTQDQDCTRFSFK